MKTIVLTGHTLTLEEVILAARGYHDEHGAHHYPLVALSDGADNINKADPEDNAVERIKAKRKGLKDRMDAGDIIYGVNTGCGVKKGIAISNEDIIAYQKHYIPAHCVMIGDYFSEEVVRAAMILRVNSFATGFSAMRLKTCKKILEFYNKSIIPCVPEQGSVGSSGDLAPLAHIAAALTGLPGQKVVLMREQFSSKPIEAAEALRLIGVKPLILEAKEAMGLTNGSTFTLALGILAIHDAEKVFDFSDLAAALSLEAIRGELNAFDPRLIGLRKNVGAELVAQNIRNLVKGSERMTAKAQFVKLSDETKKIKENGDLMPRVQDAYSFRSYPHVAGSAFTAFKYAKEVFENEINAATDNPLVFEKEDGSFEALSGGNFHGEPLGQAADFLKIALQQLANISDRRFYALTMSSTSYGLPSDLMGQSHPTLNTGLMILQYSTASLVSENKVLCHPSVVDSIPTSANQEDYVSMSTTSARHLRRVVKNTAYVIAAELLAAAQGISLSEKTLAENDCAKLGLVTERAYEMIREVIPVMDDDRMLSLDWEKMVELMHTEEFQEIAITG